MNLLSSSASSASLGSYLKQARLAVGLTLRSAAARTSVTNGYLSQIESGSIRRPSTDVLSQLALAYGLSYADLLDRAGHPVPEEQRQGAASALSGLPVEAFDDLDADEVSELLNYLAFLKSRRPSAR